MDPARHVAWQTAWGVVVGLVGLFGLGYWQSSRGSDLPAWPLWVFTAGIVIGLYFVFAHSCGPGRTGDQATFASGRRGQRPG